VCQGTTNKKGNKNEKLYYNVRAKYRRGWITQMSKISERLREGCIEEINIIICYQHYLCSFR
jgi:hypothetical protein